MALSKAAKHCKRFEQLVSERLTWDSLWQDTLDHCLTRKADVTRYQSPGQPRGVELLDSTGENCVEVLAGHLHTFLTNPMTTWFELTTGDVLVDEEDENRIWLAETAKQMHHVLNNSNFQTEIHEIYLDLTSVGTACLMMEEDDKTVIRFSAKFMGDVYVAEDRFGFIDTLYIKGKWTHRQAHQEWPDNAELKKLAEEKPDDKIEVIHCISPRSDRIYGKKDGKNMPFASTYIWRDKKVILSEGGYKTFPAAVPRWTKATGETYGRSPGMKALPDIKMIQEMMRTYMQAAQKSADPPLIVDDDGVLLPLDTNPGGLIYKRPGENSGVVPLKTGSEFQITYQTMQDTRQRIRECFYIDKLQLVQGPQQTATEVMQRSEENMRVLGPMAGRMNSEFLRPMIERIWDIMWKRKMISEPPAGLRGKKIDVQYSSVIAKAQRSQEANNLQRALAMAAPFAQVNPEILDNIDGDEVLRYGMNLYGVPARVIRDKRKVKQIRDGRAQARAEQAQAAQAAQAAQNAGAAAPMVKVLAGGGNGEQEAG